MAVFRLQDPGETRLLNGRGWFPSRLYNTVEINAMKDPDGSMGSDPTSIPSPFARIDLVRTAFKFVRNHGIEGNTSFHKIVSHALDIGEMFFNYDTYADAGQLNIQDWDKITSIANLLGSNNQNKINYGRTLQMYLQQDANGFNFNHMDRIFILLYNNIPVGGTSPVSLFFSTPNALNNDIIHHFPGGNMSFSDQPAPLQNRDEDFIRFLYALRASNPNFGGFFPEVNDYMNSVLAHIQENNGPLFIKLIGYNAASYLPYVNIGAGIFILNTIPLRQKNILIPPIILSDYTIRSTFRNNDPIQPLVIKRGHPGVASDGSVMRYYRGPFDPLINVPYEVDAPLNNRFLPGRAGIRYPYLTIGDFLEPYIIRTVFPIDRVRFMNGNFNNPDPKSPVSYLLPLKKMFFEYFNPDDLQNIVGDGRRMFEIGSLAGGSVKVFLRIPINVGYIEYERTYYADQDPNIAKNEGTIAECRFDLAIFPFMKFNVAAPNYRIALADGDYLTDESLRRHYDLEFYQLDRLNNAVAVTHRRVRIVKARPLSGLEHYVLNENFDLISINVQERRRVITGMIIPNFSTIEGGTAQFTFMIDLGTTYTHIEYSIDGGPPEPFSITAADIQLIKLHDPNHDILTTYPDVAAPFFDRELLPEIIQSGTDYNFPVRTSVQELRLIPHGGVCFPFVERNISFFYEKSPEKEHAQVKSGLKWDIDTATSERIESFISCILLMIRNKVLMNGGSLADTRIKWFYPLSMTDGRKLLLENAWNVLFNQLINPVANPPVAISESIAPFYYYLNTQGAIAFNNPLISIDIGGETTDIVVFQDNKPKLLTSFRFAADAVFGNSYLLHNVRNNNFVRQYDIIVRNTLNAHDMTTMLRVYDGIIINNILKDVIAFYFSLDRNSKLRQGNIALNFNGWLAHNQDFKIVFLVFYASIIYHVAKIIKLKELNFPRYITFSGTGSKILNILTPNLEPLERLTKIIFMNIMNLQAGDSPLNIITSNTPKELTCKGGFYAPVAPVNLDGLKVVLLGSADNRFVNNDVSYGMITTDILRSIEQEVINFIDILFNLINNRDVFDAGVFVVNLERLGDYKEALSKNVWNYINQGLALRLNEIDNPDNQILEETLFFYALKGCIHDLINAIQVNNH